jgi:hypothetical protein
MDRLSGSGPQHPRDPAASKPSQDSGKWQEYDEEKGDESCSLPTPDNIISPGTATKNGEHGTLIAMTDMIVASRRDFSEDGSSINASRAKPYSHRKGQNIRPRRSG